MSKLEQAVQAVYFGCGIHGKGKIRNALRPFFEVPSPSVEVDLDLEGHPDALVEELWAEICWHGDGPTKPALREMVERHLENHQHLLQPAPRVSDDDIEEAAADLDGLWRQKSGSGLWPTRLETETLLRDRFQPKPKPLKPWTWPEKTPYPEDWESVREWVPHDTTNLLLTIGANKGRDIGYFAAGDWWLKGPADGFPMENVTHFCALKAGPSA